MGLYGQVGLEVWTGAYRSHLRMLQTGAIPNVDVDWVRWVGGWFGGSGVVVVALNPVHFDEWLGAQEESMEIALVVGTAFDAWAVWLGYFSVRTCNLATRCDVT